MTTYWKLEENGKTYAVVRQEDKGLPERWSPSRGEWKDAPFHYKEVFGEEPPPPVVIDEKEATKLTKSKLPDISDADWAKLSGSDD